MRKRFAIVIGVAAAGVMALGAQTATSNTRGPVDSDPPDLRLSGPKRQNPQADEYCDRGRCDVKVRVSCGDEACTARAKGRLTQVNNDRLEPDGPWVVEAGETSRGWAPEMKKKAQRKQVREALGEAKKVQAIVTVRAKDAVGNVATAKRTIRLVE